jgi:pentatricopeptide repeat domain-containing protein 1
MLSKVKSNRGYINEAREIALAHMTAIKTVKEAMALVSIFNLAGDVKNSIRVLDQLASSDTSIAVDTKLFNNVLSGCARTKNWRLALDILTRMKNGNIEMDAISFGTVINALSKDGQWQLSLGLLEDMEDIGVVPDTQCYSAVINALSKGGRWQESLGLLQRMKSKNVDIDLITYNSVIYACSVVGKSDIILKLLDTMRHEQFCLDAYTYSSAIYAFEVVGNSKGALELLKVMMKEKKEMGASFNPTDSAPFNAAISTCIRSNQVEEALAILGRMKRVSVRPDTRTYTMLISACAKLGQWSEVIKLYIDTLNSNVIRNELIFGSAICACNKIGNGTLAVEILLSMMQQGLSVSTGTWNHVISALSKTSTDSCLRESMKIFELMKSAGIQRNVATYNLLISCCRGEGNSQHAYNLLAEMGGDADLALASATESSPFTFPYSNAISVCVNAKDWNLALQILDEMEQKNITRNVVTMNSVIEALDASGETIRSELVYQSALRSGVYNHWHNTSSNIQNQNLDLDRKSVV